jgi:hypothetical protein
MTKNRQEENGVWVENLWEGTWLLEIQGGANSSGIWFIAIPVAFQRMMEPTRKG